MPVFNILATWTYSPAVTLPVHTGPKGLPIGMQLVGRRGGDMSLLAMAKAAISGSGGKRDEIKGQYQSNRCFFL